MYSRIILKCLKIFKKSYTYPLDYNDTSIPVESRILVARCALLNTLAGQTVKVDISPKQ